MTMSNFINANINTSELSRKEEVSYRAQILSSEVGGGEGAPSFTITGSCDLLEASKQKPLAQRPRLPMPSQSLAKKVPEAFSEGLKVEHNYHDHANDPDGEYTGIDQVIHNGNGSGKCVEQPFPVKLHYMLNELEKDGGDNIVGWQPHGRCFVVRNQKLFVEQILGK
mgnify:CR=1 FL=1